jgi:NAD+ synthase
MAGGYNPLKDAYKMTVFAISRWRNAHKPKIGLGPEGPVIPENIITKPPSAELRPDQKDSDSLPPYDVLDAILLGLVEHEKSVAQLVSEGFDRDTVVRIERLLHLAEYKRRQAPPGVKLGSRNFGRDRRYPITHAFRSV